MKCADLFSGIGGFALGFERAGAETIAFCEVDDYASRVLEKQWPHVPNIKGGVLALNALLRKARTASRPASPVRTYPTLAKAPDLPAPVRDSSGRYFEPFAWFDREARCWRTWQRCLVEGWEIFSDTWPRSGMTRNGIAYRRAPLVLLTNGTASGSLLPTPEASNTKAIALRSAGRSPRDFLAPLPTPQARDATAGPRQPDGKRGISLVEIAAGTKWPTPRPCSGNTSSGMNRAEFYRRMGFEKSSETKGGAVESPDGGALNPTWVEWLMGFPLGWTDLGASATRSSRKLSKRSAAR